MFVNTIYRLGNYFHRKRVPILPRCFEIMNQVVNSCDVPVRTNIGANSRFWHHGLGVVINPKCTLGTCVQVYPQVLLGGFLDGEPKIGNNVFIASGAKIIGKVTIGDFVIIGANAVVSKDVEPFSIMGGIPAKKIGIISAENYDKYSVCFPFSQSPFKNQ